MKKVKPAESQTPAHSERLEQSLPNLEQIDTAVLPKAKQNAEKVLQLKARISEIVTKVKKLQASLLIFIEAKAAMKKIDTLEKDFFTVNDVDTEIKLLKQQIQHFGFVELKIYVKIEILLTEESYLDPEVFERNLLKLRLQEKEICRDIRNQALAIDALNRVSEEFFKNPSKSSWEDFQIKECIKAEIQLLEKEKSKNKSRLEDIKEKIKILKAPKFNQDTSPINQTKQSFFNGKAESNNSVAELKTKGDPESHLSRI